LRAYFLAALSPPSKVISKTFKAAFQRLLQRCRPRPVGFEADDGEVEVLQRGLLIREVPRAFTARRNLALSDSIALVVEMMGRTSGSKSLSQNACRVGSLDHWFGIMSCGHVVSPGRP
jgi:hypothetical protein